MQTSSTQSGVFDRLFGWWYALATPPAVPYYASLRERAFMRRARFTSIILLIEIIYYLLNFALSRNFSLQTNGLIGITLACFGSAAILNRFGKTLASGMLGFAVVEISMCLNIVNLGLASGGLAVKDLATISLLILPELIVISLFPALVALLLCVFNCSFSVGAILFFPKTPEMVQLLTTSGLNYFWPVGIQGVVSAASIFWVRTAERETERADRVEEVSKLTQTLALQQNTALMEQQQVREKQQLEEIIQKIVAVHMQAASGDFSARVPLEQQNILWSIGISLNNLLARLQRWKYDEQKQHQRTEQAIQGLLYEIRRARWQGRPLHIQKTGTSLDLLLDELSKNTPSRQSPSYQSARLTSPPPDNRR